MNSCRIPGVNGLSDSGHLAVSGASRTAGPRGIGATLPFASAAVCPFKATASAQEVLESAARFLIDEENCPPRPYWPGQAGSGVTIGVGWDLSEQTQKTLDADWAELPALDRKQLAIALGTSVKGEAARALIPGLTSVSIPRDVATAVLRRRVLPRYMSETRRAFPGVERLPADAQVALISLVFNRGGSMGKESKTVDRRWEMRRIREAVARCDLEDIAAQLRAMKRLWQGVSGSKGLLHRRDREADLVERSIPREFQEREPLLPREWLTPGALPICPSSPIPV